MATKTILLEPDIAADIVSRIRPYLEHSPIHGTALEILPDSLHLEEDWWYVPVRLNSEEPRAYEYYDLLIDIEDEIKEKEHLKVLFVPAN